MAEQSKSKSPAEEAFPKSKGVSFDATSLGSKITNRYVAWLDLMGARNIMGRFLSRASSHIGMIHAAALDAAKTDDVQVYPVIDGCYVISEEREKLQQMLSSTMDCLASVFVHESSDDNRFLVRGGVAGGRIIAGRDLALCNTELAQHREYAGCLAIGTAVGQAYSAESNAPPFGFWIDITARAFRVGEAHPFTDTLWRWWDETPGGKLKQQVLGKALRQYFDWAENNRRALEYPLDRLREHRDAAREYFQWEVEAF